MADNRPRRITLGSEEWKKHASTPYKKVEEVTYDMVQAAANQACFLRGSVRLMTGRVMTSSQIAERRRDILGTDA